MWSPQRSKILFNLGVLLSLAGGLTGCGELNSQFTCPMKPGVSCQSLDQVNSLVDQGKLAEAKPLSSTPSTLTVNIQYSNDDVVTRQTEQVMRLWIAPYQDSQGNYFSDSVVYHVIQPGQWSTPSSIKDSAHA